MWFISLELDIPLPHAPHAPMKNHKFPRRRVQYFTINHRSGDGQWWIFALSQSGEVNI